MTTDQGNDTRSDYRDVLVAYLTVVDHHRATDALPCFTDDAQIVARGRPLNGREEISRFLAERQADTARRTSSSTRYSSTSTPTKSTSGRESSCSCISPLTATASTRSSKPLKRSAHNRRMAHCPTRGVATPPRLVTRTPRFPG